MHFTLSNLAVAAITCSAVLVRSLPVASPGLIQGRDKFEKALLLGTPDDLIVKRAFIARSSTAPIISIGGDGQSGDTNNVDGGNVANIAGNGMTNDVDANIAGHGGSTHTGYAVGGNGDIGGNAVSGNSGNAFGGTVHNWGGKGEIENSAHANAAGFGGEASSGPAIGGEAPTEIAKRILSYSPTSPIADTFGSDLQVGTIEKKDVGQNIESSDNANEGGNGGVSQSGYAQGGDGAQRGGDAISGNASVASGGSIDNITAGKVSNTVDANRGGNGGASWSGAGIGGDSGEN